MQEDFRGVRISVPQQQDDSREVVLRGPKDTVARAHKHIESLLGYEVDTEPLLYARLDLPHALHGAIIGKGGQTLRDLECEFGVDIVVPKREEQKDVTIEGRPANVEAARSKIEHMVHQSVPLAPIWPHPAYPDHCESKEHVASRHEKVDLTVPLSEVLFFPDQQNTTSNLDRFLQFLQSATTSIDICIFTFSDDQIANVVEDAHNRGIHIRLITDNNTVNNVGSDIEKLSRAGIPVKCDYSEHHMHNKFAILDGVCVMNGSFNWTRQASQSNCENVIVTNHEIIVSQFVSYFNRLWSDPVRFYDYVPPAN
eukprot:TRINITY_DN4910_c0_g1_i6.p1 TRINITY_DN4910_c0_g1~~TRINITY_DN4910_c0_g1_i6.p1  ORF type:complete len:311 (-),score=92.16 TRINITY_DN4910_c0_g1_i6:74-1006(-)